ncbi:membrane protein [Arthrobacter phage Rizwana]|nr:membrane protein [Arthrobacter phage Rizwana]
MSSLLPLNALVIAVVGVCTLVVMIYWHTVTKGTWKRWPAGQSLMLLLAIIAVITLNAAVNILVPHYWGKVGLYFGLYGALILAIFFIGWTIRKEMRKGKARLVSKTTTPTGPVNVIVADTNEENPHVESDTTTRSIPSGGYWTGTPGGPGTDSVPRILADRPAGGSDLPAGTAGLSASGDSDSA